MLNDKRYIFKIGLVSSIGALALACYGAQTKSALDIYHTFISTQQARQDIFVPGWASVPRWASGNWTASDKPYLPIIAESDQWAAQGKLCSNDVNDATEAAKGTNDPLKVATAAYREYRLLRMTFPQNYRDLNTILTALKEMPNPHAYQFSRIAFLVSAYDPPTDHPWLTSLGDRLLKQNPTDPDLVYARVRAGMPFMLSPLEKKKLLGYANRLVAARPHDLTSYMTLEMVYDASFTGTGNRADGKMTLGLLKKMQAIDTNPAREAWDIQEAKVNQALLDETAGPH